MTTSKTDLFWEENLANTQSISLEKVPGEWWCCVSVKLRMERMLASFCKTKGIRFFLPEIKFECAVRNNPKKSVITNLYPEYVFCSLTPENQHLVRELPFVRRIDTLNSSEDLGQLREIQFVLSSENETPQTQARKELLKVVDAINTELIKELSKNPKFLYELPPSRFEELVAELLRNMGYNIYITPKTRDGGRDILTIFEIPTGQLLTVVECKRFSPDRKIGPEIVQRLLWVSEHQDRASRAMVATTSFFTSGARTLENQYKWKLSLKDFDGVCEWLNDYGKWASKSTGGIWIPKTAFSTNYLTDAG